VPRLVAERHLALPFDEELVLDLAEAGDDQELELGPVLLEDDLITERIDEDAAPVRSRLGRLRPDVG